MINFSISVNHKHSSMIVSVQKNKNISKKFIQIAIIFQNYEDIFFRNTTIRVIKICLSGSNTQTKVMMECSKATFMIAQFRNFLLCLKSFWLCFLITLILILKSYILCFEKSKITWWNLSLLNSTFIWISFSAIFFVIAINATSFFHFSIQKFVLRLSVNNARFLLFWSTKLARSLLVMSGLQILKTPLILLLRGDWMMSLWYSIWSLCVHDFQSMWKIWNS